MVIAIFMASLSCSSDNDDDSMNVSELDGKFTIVEVVGDKIEKNEMPYIEFNIAEKWYTETRDVMLSAPLSF